MSITPISTDLKKLLSKFQRMKTKPISRCTSPLPDKELKANSRCFISLYIYLFIRFGLLLQNCSLKSLVRITEFSFENTREVIKKDLYFSWLLISFCNEFSASVCVLFVLFPLRKQQQQQQQTDLRSPVSWWCSLLSGGKSHAPGPAGSCGRRLTECRRCYWEEQAWDFNFLLVAT